MTTVTTRNIDPALKEELRVQAVRHGRSSRTRPSQFGIRAGSTGNRPRRQRRFRTDALGKPAAAVSA
jgi:plasmid stability protein